MSGFSGARRAIRVRRRVALAAAVAGCVGAPVASRAQLAWDPLQTGPTTGASGGPGVWSTDPLSTFWFDGGGNVVWDNTSAATFGGTLGGLVTINNGGAGVSADGLTFNTSGYTVAGPDALTLVGNGVVTVNQSATVSASVGGAVGLNVGGGALLTLSSTNSTYTGTTTLGGTATLRAGAANVFRGSEAYVLGAGTVLDLNGFANAVGSLEGAASGTVNLGAGTLTVGGGSASTSFDGVIRGTGGLTKTGAGTFTLNGSSTYSGATTVNGGVLALGASDRIADSSAVTIASGGTFSLGGFNETVASIAGAGSLQMGAGNLTVGPGNASTTFSGVITGTGTLFKRGTGSLTLTGTSNPTWTGTLDVAGGGTVIIDSWLRISNTNAGGGSINIDGGTLRNTDSAVGGNFMGSSRTIAIGSNGATFDVSNAAGILVYTGVVTGGTNSTLTKTGAGEFRGLKNWTFAKLVVNQGLYRINGTGGDETGFGAVPATFDPSALTINGGSVGTSISITTGTNRGITIGTNGGGIVLNAGWTINSPITGPGALLVKSGASAQLLTINGSNSFLGGLTITNATVRGSNGSAIPDLAPLSFTGTQTAVFDIGVGKEVVGSIASLGSGTSGAISISSGGVLTAGGNNASTTFAGNISGAGGFAKVGTGTLTLLGWDLTYTGTTQISQGVIKFGDLNAGFSSSTAMTIAAGAALDMNNINDTFGSLAGAGNVSNGVTLTVGGNGNTTTFSGVYSGGGSASLTKSGTGTLTISGLNAYGGSTRVFAGGLSVSSDANLGTVPGALNPTAIILNSTTTAGTLITTSSFTLNPNRGMLLQSGTSLLTGVIQTSAGTLTYGGPISGAGALAKSGAGTLALTGTANTFAGGTFLRGGTLRVGADNALPTGTTLTFGDAAVPTNLATLDLGDAGSGASFNQTVAGLGVVAGGAATNATITNSGTGLSTLTVNLSGAGTFDGFITGGVALNKLGAGALTLGGANAFTGGMTIGGGQVVVGADANLGGPLAPLSIGAGTLVATAGFTSARPLAITDALSAIDVAAGQAVTFTGGLSGGGSLTKGTSGGALTIAPAGTASFANLTASSGTVTIGHAVNGLGGPLNVAGTLSVAGAARVALASPTPTNSVGSVTNNFIGTLQLAPTATLDVGKHTVLFDNVATPVGTLVTALKQAYNFNTTTKFGLWDGVGGITSSGAVTSVADGNGRITLAFVDGAIQNKYPGLNLKTTLGGPTLATNRTLVRAALMGDVNLDGKVDGDDISVIAQFGRYNKTAPDGWINGDLNYDGVVNGDDISLIAQTKTYRSGEVYGAQGAVSDAAANIAAASAIGVTGDKIFDYVYDRNTGELRIQYDGDTSINSDTPLATLKVLSAAGRINVTVANQNRPSGVTRPFTTTANEITWTFFEPADGTFQDGYSFGNIFPAGLTAAQVLADLDLSFARSGALGYTTADLVVVPEPSAAVALLGAAAVGFLARRRRRAGAGG